MQKSSWIVLTVCIALAALLGFGYVMSRAEPEPLTQATAQKMIGEMEKAVENKSVSTLMSYVADDDAIRLDGISRDRMRMLLTQAFRATGALDAEAKNVTLAGGNGSEAVINLDLSVKDNQPGMQGDIYSGHVTLNLKRVEIPHLLGLYRTYAWRVVSAEQTGRSLTSFGDL